MGSMGTNGSHRLQVLLDIRLRMTQGPCHLSSSLRPLKATEDHMAEKPGWLFTHGHLLV